MFSTKGGAGRTTLAANLAVAFALQNRRTALVDYDLHSGDVDQVLGLAPEKTIDDLIQEEDYAKAEEYFTVFDEHLSVLTSPTRPEPALRLDSAASAEILTGLRHSYDFIVVDLPATLANHVAGALETADFIGLVTGNDILSVKNAVFALQSLALLGYDLQAIRLVANPFDRRGLTTVEMSAAIGLPVYWSFDRDENLLDSLNRSKPVVIDKPRSSMSVDIKRLASALAIEYGKVRKE